MTERYPGDPGPGHYYVGWAGPQSIATGQSWSTAPLGVYHNYSTAADARVDSAKLDVAIAAGLIPSQSFKLTTWTPAQVAAGSADAAIDASAAICIARAPHPIWLCYFHEPEDNFPSSTDATNYRAAYRRIVTRFRAAGVTNVAWMPIFQAPYTFRTSAMGRPGGGSNRDWRWWHPDWNGGTTGTSADWDSDLMMDVLGLDVYDPLPGGTSEQDFTLMLDDTLNQIYGDGYPAHPIVFPEFGISKVATPTPSWPSWCATARDYALSHDINAFIYWNNNNDTPRRYDFTAASDPDGTKLLGWHVITDGAKGLSISASGRGTATLTGETVGLSLSSQYLVGDADALLISGGGSSFTGAGTFTATTYAGITITEDGQFTQANPYVMAGVGGSITVPAAGTSGTPFGDKWLQYQAPFAGSMVMNVTEPSGGLPFDYYVYEADGDELQTDTDGELGLVLFGADLVTIKLHDTGSIIGTGGSTYFSFPGSPLIIDPDESYEIEATFTQATVDAGDNELDILLLSANTQEAYDDTGGDLVGQIGPDNLAAPAASLTIGPDDGGDFDTLTAAGLTYALFSTDPDSELTRIRWRLVRDTPDEDDWIEPDLTSAFFYDAGGPQGEVTSVVDDGFVLTWSYAARASSRLIVQPERVDVLETPGAISVNIANGYPGDTVVFSVVGPTTVLDFQTATLTWAGILEDYPIMLPALQPGNYVLHCEAVGSGAEDVSFHVLNEPLTFDNLDLTDPEPPAVTVQRWTFYDVRDADQNWTLQRNPKAWTNMHPPNDFTHENTTAPDGQILTWQAGSRPWRMEFNGYIDNQAEYERFVFWSDQRRRLWLIDHRNRAWLVTLEHFDAQARIEPNKPWSHDYTVRALIFKQATD